MTKKFLPLPIIGALLLLPVFTVTDASGKSDKAARKAQDHEIARSAVLRGEVLPLRKILTLAGRYQTGELIEIELESKQGRVFYDVHVLTTAGVVRELYIDARSGKLIVNRVKED